MTLRVICPDCTRIVTGLELADGRVVVGWHKREHRLCAGCQQPAEPTGARPHRASRRQPPPGARPAGLPSALRGCP